MVKRIKWVAYCDQLEQYQQLKVVPLYCQVTRPVPQIWGNDAAFCSWWESQITELQQSLFKTTVHNANSKANSLIGEERKAIEKLGRDLSSPEIEEAKGALKTLETRLRASEGNSRRVALARDIGGKPGPSPRSKKSKNRSSRPKGPFKKNQPRAGNKQPRAGDKRKAQEGKNLSDSNTKLAELIVAGIMAAKRQEK
jgi:hypothetical protein